MGKQLILLAKQLILWALKIRVLILLILWACELSTVCAVVSTACAGYVPVEETLLAPRSVVYLTVHSWLVVDTSRGSCTVAAEGEICIVSSERE